MLELSWTIAEAWPAPWAPAFGPATEIVEEWSIGRPRPQRAAAAARGARPSSARGVQGPPTSEFASKCVSSAGWAALYCRADNRPGGAPQQDPAASSAGCVHAHVTARIVYPGNHRQAWHGILSVRRGTPQPHAFAFRQAGVRSLHDVDSRSILQPSVGQQLKGAGLWWKWSADPGTR